MKVSLVSFAAEHFNNNGDQGNITVLEFHLRNSGFSVEHLGQSQADSADFLLVGDCSRAALRFYKPGLDALLPALRKRLEGGKPTLLVGSSYEYLSAELGLGISKTVQRVSDFVSTQAEGFSVLGYCNSDTDLPVVQIHGAFIATKLFGPVLALNPELLELVLSRLGAQLKLSVEMSEDITQIRKQISA